MLCRAEEGLPGEWEADEGDAARDSGGGRQTQRTCYRLRKCQAFWKRITVSTLVLAWIVAGVPLLWGSNGPTEPYERSNHSSCEQHAAFIDSAVAGLLEKGAIAIAHTAPVVVSPLAVIARRGKNRLVLDLSELNRHLRPAPPFKYETIAAASDVFQQGDWMFSVDLEAAYHHVDMHPSAWKYLGFRWRGETYIFRVLPFGLSTACWVFTKITRELAGHWRSRGIRLHHYLDDFGFAARPDAQGGPGAVLQLRSQVLSDISEVGFLTQPAKLHPPTQRLPFIGFVIDTVTGRLHASADRARELLEAVQAVLAAGSSVPARQLGSVSGRIASLLPALGHAARIFTRDIHACLPADGKSGWRRHVTVSPDAQAELAFWQNEFAAVDGQPLWPSTRVDTVLYSDAGARGWGGHTSAGGTAQEACGSFSPAEQEQSSTLREAWALLRTLCSLPHLRGRRLRAYVDNQALEYC